jgi:tetratricopeptide (TPR) repeat protein
MGHDIRNHQRRRLLLLCGLTLLLTLVAGGLLGSRAMRGANAISAQELGKLNHFIQNSNAKDDSMKALRQGRDQIEDEDWGAAEATFNSFVANYPKSKEVDAALYWMAFALKKQGKYADANRQLDRLLREHPRSNWLDDAQAMRLEIAGRTGSSQNVERALGESDMEIKLIALQSLFRSNQERAVAFVADLLKPGSTADRKLKKPVGATQRSQHDAAPSGAGAQSNRSETAQDRDLLAWTQ